MTSFSDENGNYAFNAMANHSCDTGFVLVGNNTRTCTGDGSSTTGVFDGEAAICECEPMQNVTLVVKYRIAGNFRGTKYSWFSNIETFRG